MIKLRTSSALVGFTLLLATTAVADDRLVQACQWQCGAPQNSKSGCDGLDRQWQNAAH